MLGRQLNLNENLKITHMKKALLILCCQIFFSYITYSQGLFAGYRQEKIVLNVTQYPLNPLPEEFKTYNSIIHPGGIDFTYIRRVKPIAWVETGNRNNYGSVKLAEEEFLTLLGFEKNTQSPDLWIEVTLQNAEIKNKQMSSRECVFIENKQRITRTFYSYLLTYTFGAALKVSDKKGNVLIDEIMHDPTIFNRIYLGEEAGGGINRIPGGSYTSPYELEEGLQRKFYGEYIYDKIHSSLMSAARKINGEYSTFDYPMEFQVAYSRTTRRNNYEDLEKAVELMKEAAVAYNAKSDVSDYFPKLDEAIEIWETALLEADLLERNARIDSRIAPQLYENIAIALIWKRDWEKVNSTYEECFKYTGVVPSNTRILLNFTTDMQKRHEVNGITF